MAWVQYFDYGNQSNDGGGKEGATVQIMGIGPSSTTFLFPQVGDFGEPHKLN